MSTFKIGEKVVCVTNAPLDFEDIIDGVTAPKVKEIYTIRTMESDKTGTWITVEEIINPVFNYLDGFGEASFNINYFRKLDYQFAENLLAELTQSAKNEYQLN